VGQFEISSLAGLPKPDGIDRHCRNEDGHPVLELKTKNGEGLG
jgi:hypothetical protein